MVLFTLQSIGSGRVQGDERSAITATSGDPGREAGCPRAAERAAKGLEKSREGAHRGRARACFAMTHIYERVTLAISP